MADMLEPFQKPIRKPRGYLLISFAILFAAWGGYVGWQHRAAAEIAAAASDSTSSRPASWPWRTVLATERAARPRST